MSGRPTITPSSSVTMVSLCRRMVPPAGAVTLIALAPFLRLYGERWLAGRRRAPALSGARRPRVLCLQVIAAAGGGQPNGPGLADRHLLHLLLLLPGRPDRASRCYALKSCSDALSYRW